MDRAGLGLPARGARVRRRRRASPATASPSGRRTAGSGSSPPSACRRRAACSCRSTRASRAPRRPTSSRRSRARVLVTVDGFLGNALRRACSTRRTRCRRPRAGRGPALGAASRRAATVRWEAFLAAGDEPATPRRGRVARLAASRPTTSPTCSSRRAPPGKPEGRDLHARAEPARASQAWTDVDRPARRRSLPGREPLLPLLRLQGRDRGLPASRGATLLPHAGVRRARGARAASPRERVTVLPGPPTRLPVDPEPPRLAARPTSSSLRLAVTGAAAIPVELVAAHARRARLRDGGHRLRAHRGAAASPRCAATTTTPRRSPRPRAARSRASRCAASTTPGARCRAASPARSSCAATT